MLLKTVRHNNSDAKWVKRMKMCFLKLTVRKFQIII